MPNKEQLAILMQGVKIWNRWREENPEEEIDLFGADLSNASLNGANLSSVNLSDASLSNSDVIYADLSNANLISANLNGANFFSANFFSANLNFAHLEHANLIRANLSDANLNYARLNGANLGKANLSDAKLHKVDLNNAKLSDVNLSNANLSESQVLNTNFTEATLTAACIADWQIGSSTKLDGVICDYIFRTYDTRNKKFSGRLPVDPNHTFSPGEFTKHFQILAIALEAIDITFTEGINWQAFLQAFQEVTHSHPDDSISIQGMERKRDAFVVRLKVEADVDKAAIETKVKQVYATQLAALEMQYEKRLRLRSQEISHYRQTQSSLIHIVQTMAEKDPITQTFNTPLGHVSAANQGRMQAIQHNDISPEKKDLVEAATEIQRLLKVLEETNPIATEAEQAAFVAAGVAPTMRKRAANALKSEGQAAIEELLDTPYANAAIAIIEGWRES